MSEVVLVGLWVSTAPSQTVDLFRRGWFLQYCFGFLLLESLALPDEFG